MKKVKSICVQAKEWFDKVNGNSYFSADIFVNGDIVHRLPFEYGYSEYYLQAANKWLADNDYLPDSTLHISSQCRDLGIDLYYSKSENCRKRDLYKG